MGRERIGVLINPEDGGTAHSYYNNRTSRPTSTDTNILIVTSSLFAVLVLALCMHFTIRWALSHFFHVTSPADSAPSLPSSSSSSSGLLKAHVDSLPTTLYTKNAELAVRLDASSQCPICFDDFADGDPIRVLPNCQHSFHMACIDTWFAKHTSCPTCRGSLMNALPPSHVRLHILITKGSALPPRIP